MLNKKFYYITLVILVLIILFVGCWLWSYQNSKKLSVVYLSSSEIYVGHLKVFPKMVLTDVYILQGTNQTDGQLRQELFPLSGKPWAPVKLYLNRDQVIFHGPIKDDSEVARGIKEKQGNK